MEIKVRDLGSAEEKSVAQKEQEVLDNAASKDVAEVKVAEVEAPKVEAEPQTTDSEEPKSESPKEVTQSSELSEDDVLSFIKNNYLLSYDLLFVICFDWPIWL